MGKVVAHGQSVGLVGVIGELLGFAKG